MQTASAVLCYSRMLFFQIYPTFQRFDCKVFLTDALRYMGGATARVMIDNTHVVVLRGSGTRDGAGAGDGGLCESVSAFSFVAHAIGDANRSARVERPFHFIENNFLAGRTFASWEDLNQRARQWCDKVNATYKKHIRAVPRELFAVERLHLKPLPAWIPEVYRLHQRTGGYRRLCRAEQQPLLGSGGLDRPPRGGARDQGQDRDSTRCPPPGHAPAHRRSRAPARHAGRAPAAARPEASRAAIRIPKRRPSSTAAPELADYVAGLKQRSRKVVTLALRQLLRLVREYPREPLLGAVREAARYGLYDLDRLERMILRRVTREYFLLDGGIRTMTEELEQLLKNLKLRRMLEIYDEQLRAADKDDSQLLGVRRRAWCARSGRPAGERAGVAHPARESARALVAGDVSLRPPAGREPQTDSRVRRTGVHRQGARISCWSGETGVGKTGLACGLLLKALQNGYRCQFIRAQDLFDEMYASLADRSTRQLLNRLARLDVLLIDEIGYLNLKPEQSNIFFKLMEERYRQHSTIITTNLGL